jgi:inorganic pyrophosphatase
VELWCLPSSTSIQSLYIAQKLTLS